MTGDEYLVLTFKRSVNGGMKFQKKTIREPLFLFISLLYMSEMTYNL